MAPVSVPGPQPRGPSRVPHFGAQQGSQPHPSPVTAVWSSGFEDQVAAYTGAGGGLCTSTSGTIGSATDQFRSGAASLKYTTTAASVYIDVALPSVPVMVYRGYHRFNALPPGTSAILVTCLVALQNCDILLTSGGVLQAQVETGTAVSGPTIVAGQWYRIEACYDYRSNPTRLSWMVDGVSQTTATLAQATTVITDFRIGAVGGTSLTGWIDDAIVSTTASDYPIGPGYSKVYIPTGKGTHAPGAGAFQDNTAAAITDAGDSATQSWLRIDEQPPNTTDYVVQTTADANGYLEYTLGQSAQGNPPNAVTVNSAIEAASAASCDMSVKANDSGTISAGKTITTAVTTPSYGREVLATRPSTGARWTEDAYNNLRVRAGYAVDATPNPRLDAVWVEVDYAGVEPTTGATTTQNITDTGVTQTDSLLMTVVRVIADTGATQTDTVATTRRRIITDTGVTQTDSVGRGFLRAVADTGVSQSDTVATTRRRVLADTGVSQSDTVATTRRRVLTDTGVTQSDAVGRGFPRAVTDTGVSQSDSVATVRRRALADTGVTQTDSVLRTVRRLISDTGVSNTDTVAARRVRVVVDYAFTEVFPGSATFPGATLFPGGTISDTVATTRARLLTDTGVTQTDTVATTRVRPLADTGASVTDSVATTRRRIITDTGVSQSDSVVATHGGVTGVTDTGVTQSDTVATTRRRVLADTGATITDSVATTRRRILADTGLAQSDSVSATRGALRAVTDTGLSQTDSVTSTAVHPRNITDTGATVSDAVSSTRRRVVTDTGSSVTDNVKTTRVRFITDTGVSQSDTVTPATVRPRFITDTGATITDSVVRTASSTHTYRSFTGYATQTEWTGAASQTGWTSTPTRTYATSTTPPNDLTGVPSQTGIVGAVAL